MLVSHLFDVEEFMQVAVVPRPGVHEHTGAAAATVHHQPVIQVGVIGVRSLHIWHPTQTSRGDTSIKMIRFADMHNRNKRTDEN